MTSWQDGAEGRGQAARWQEKEDTWVTGQEQAHKREQKQVRAHPAGKDNTSAHEGGNAFHCPEQGCRRGETTVDRVSELFP